jgi:cytochrome P450
VIKSLFRKQTNIPTLSGGLPFFGQMFSMISGSPWDKMAQWVHECGTIYRIHLFGSDMIVVADPNILKVILSTKLSLFKKDLEWTYKPFLTILGKGLVTADGINHRQQRTLLASHFRTDLLDGIPEMALRAYQRLSIKLNKVKMEGSVIEMSEEFRHLTLQVIAEVILSLPPDESDRTFAHMYLPIVEEGNKRTWNPERAYIPNKAWFDFGKAVKKLNNYVTNLIKERYRLKEIEKLQDKKSTRPNDVLEIRIDSVPLNEWNDSTIKQIRDEVKTFILAGHETSASMLSWSLLELTRNPSLAETIRKEACQVFHGHLSTNGKTLISIPHRSELDKLVFSEACLRESLRLYSVVPSVVRVNSEAVAVGPYYIPHNSTIILNIQGVHHNPQYWPEPLKYNPYRFLGQQDIQSYTFIPFIEGPRMCIGQYLSLLESKVVLSALMLSYNFTIQNPDTAGIKHPYMVPIIPKDGHFMMIS